MPVASRCIAMRSSESRSWLPGSHEALLVLQSPWANDLYVDIDNFWSLPDDASDVSGPTKGRGDRQGRRPGDRRLRHFPSRRESDAAAGLSGASRRAADALTTEPYQQDGSGRGRGSQHEHRGESALRRRAHHFRGVNSAADRDFCRRRFRNDGTLRLVPRHLVRGRPRTRSR